VFLTRRCQKLLGSLVIGAAFLACVSCARQVCYVPPYASSSVPQQQASISPRSMSAAPVAAHVSEKCLTELGPTRTISHEVGPLETIWRISRMYDVPVESICAANRIGSGDALRLGQKLVIPNTRMMRNIVPLYPNAQWKYVIIHHTASDMGKALQVDRWHHDRGFWNGIGYHFLIDNGTLGKGDGQIEVSPRWIKQMCGAHCKAGGMNDKGIGIALVGNFNEEVPTQNQLQSLAYLINTLCRYYRIETDHIMGHRDVEGASTDCPGKRFPWPNLRQCLSRY
jgi:N-acetylmuramoyl-L-alanine amidase